MKPYDFPLCQLLQIQVPPMGAAPLKAGSLCEETDHGRPPRTAPTQFLGSLEEELEQERFADCMETCGDLEE